MNTFKRTEKAASKNKHNASIVRVLGACILLCVAFCAGFLVRGNSELLTAMGFSSFETDSQVNPGMTVSGDTYNSISARVAEIDGILSQGSLDSYDLDQTTEYVLNVFLDCINDPYLRYYDEQSYESYLSSTTNSSAGIGLLFGEDDGECFVSDVFESSQAALAGVQAGDRIVSIDGDSRDTWSAPDVLEALSRDEGDSVSIVWSRPTSSSDEENTTYSTTLTITSESQENVSYTLDESVAIINIAQISSNSATLVSDAIADATEEGAESFVLDLRDVPGGYLSQAVDIASLFIQSGEVVQIETVEGITTRSADGNSITNLPVVVLINERTSGCAEVLAAALQDSDRAEVVGERSLGKGSVQVIQPLSFGGALRYSAAYYLSPSGKQIDDSGVAPDIEAVDEDTQESVAIEVARSLIS